LIDGWHQEGSGIGVNVNWIHTKFMLIDLLDNKPITLTDPPFQRTSVTTNDENMVPIRGVSVADIYFGELCGYSHQVCESVKRHIEQFRPAALNTWKPQDLFEDWKSGRRSISKGFRT
jgi:hypothetical protein